MTESQTLGAFVERVSQSTSLKLKLVWLTFAVLGVPLAAAVSLGLPGRIGLVLALVLAAPVFYALFGAVEGARGVRISVSGMLAVFAESTAAGSFLVVLVYYRDLLQLLLKVR